MKSSVLIDNFNFVPQGFEHWVSNLIFLGIGILIILVGKKYHGTQFEKKWIIGFALFVAVWPISMPLFRLYTGSFDKTLYLPLHLCNIMPFIIPFALFYKNKVMWSVLYYWILLGTLQALITPTLEHSFPHYEYLRYFIVHAGLVILALYPVFVYGWKVKFYDACRSAIYLNGLGMLMYFIDLILDANYMYMIAKPPGPTLYDVLGEWPYYLISLQAVILLGFLILSLPIYQRSTNK